MPQVQWNAKTIKALDQLELMHYKMNQDGPINPKNDYRMHYIQQAVKLGLKPEVSARFTYCKDGLIRAK